MLSIIDSKLQDRIFVDESVSYSLLLKYPVSSGCTLDSCVGYLPGMLLYPKLTHPIFCPGSPACGVWIRAVPINNSSSTPVNGVFKPHIFLKGSVRPCVGSVTSYRQRETIRLIWCTAVQYFFIKLIQVRHLWVRPIDRLMLRVLLLCWALQTAWYAGLVSSRELFHISYVASWYVV